MFAFWMVCAVSQKFVQISKKSAQSSAKRVSVFGIGFDDRVQFLRNVCSRSEAVCSHWNGLIN